MQDGSIIPAEKDCGCLDEIHEGPHWLHMDDVDKKLNKKYLERGDAASLQVFARLEIQRLQTKHRELVSRKIEEIIR